MTAHADRSSSLAPRPRFPGLFVPGTGLRAAVLTLAALLAAASGAAAQTAESGAFGQRVDLTLVDSRGGATEVESGPEPLASGAAPPAYDLADVASSTRVDGPPELGNVLTTMTAEVDARSALPDLDDAEANAAVAGVRLNLAGRLTLDAGAVNASAEVLPDDGQGCWSGTTADGGATFTNAVLGGSLVPVPIELPAAPPPNYVAFEGSGVSVILNEQVIGDGQMSVHAVHVRVDSLAIDDESTLQGDVYIGHADAVVGCGGAEVSVAVVDSADPGAVGVPVTYTATVSNDGPERALDTLLSVLFPVAVNPQSATPSQGQCSISGRIVTCSLGDIRVGETATVAVVASPVHSGAVAVPVDVAAANSDAFPENNHATETTRVHGQATFKTADLRIELADSADPIEVGQNLTYTMTARHLGGVTVQSAFATLELPFGLTLLSVTPGQGSCSGNPTVICNLGSMAAGQQVPVTVTVRVNRGNLLKATAVVSSAVSDPDVANNEEFELTQAEDPPA